MFSNWIQTHSDLMVLATFLSGAVLSTFLISTVLKQFKSLNKKVEFDDDWLISITSAQVALSAVVLGFSLVLVLTQYDKVEANVALEADRINDLDRLMGFYGDPQLLTQRKNLLDYTKSIVQDEWHELTNGNYSEKTTHSFRPVFRGVAQLQPANFRESGLYNEMIKKLDEIEGARAERISSSKQGLHFIFWVINGLIFLGVSISSALGMVHGSAVRTLSLYLQITALAGLTAIVFIIDSPFKGQTSITSDAFHTAIAHIEARQHFLAIQK